MAERMKRAAAWLGLVTDDRYADDDPHGTERTEGISREELLETTGRPTNVTPLETRRSVPANIPASSVPASSAPASSAPASIVGAPSAAAPPVHAPTAQGPAPAPQPRTADISRIVTVHPRTYNEARTIGEHFRDGVPVIMNLTEMEDVDAKRLVDFSAGLIFGLRGTIERVTSKVFLLSPQNVSVTAEDKERIAGGFFNQS